ncbi:MAG: hypothetical protein AAGJ46_04185 [Planctomycetota bacterium]
MTKRTGFYRKIGYGAGMAALLFPLWSLSAPAIPSAGEEGGVLAKMRTENNLGQGDLGEIDPASETMKLATLGLRGVAVNLLWHQANHYKKTENWSRLTATLDQLAKLQPNFITFWKYQSWNQSYNLSVEFDDYRDRYYYVRRGIEFLEQGEKFNRDNPQILWELGWFIGQKIGRADEVEQYRRLFKADDEYHKDRPADRRDNWLVSKEWYDESVVAADDRGRGIGRKSPLVFYASSPKSQMNYSEAIEEDGEFETAEASWGAGESEWIDFGRRDVEHSTGVILRLSEQERVAELTADAMQRLEELEPESFETLMAELRAKLTDAQRAALEKPDAERTPEERTEVRGAERALRFQPAQLAAQIGEDKPERRREADRLAAEAMRLDQLLRFTKAYKKTANYDYWLMRCQFEQTEDAIDARQAVFLGKKAFNEELDPVKAKGLYERAMRSWRKVVDAFPETMDPDGTTGEDIVYHVIEYNRVLDQLDEEIPDDFPLWEVVAEFDTDRKLADELAAYQERQRMKAADAGPQPTPAAAPAEGTIEESPEETEPESGTDAASPESPPASEPSEQAMEEPSPEEPSEPQSEPASEPSEPESADPETTEAKPAEPEPVAEPKANAEPVPEAGAGADASTEG